MSKLTKLIRKPKLFFKDMILKKRGEKPAAAKPAAKPATFDHNLNINIFDNILVLHTGEKYNALAHIKIWYPYFVESGMSFIILTRFIEAYNTIIKEYPHANIVFAKDKKEIDMLFSLHPNIKACFYPSNTGNNNHLLYQTEIKHIFIGHGDSDKSASAHKFFRVYDENWVAGQAHIDRFINTGFSLNGLKNIKVGRPSLLNALKSTSEHWTKRFDKKYSVLYLPTWEGTYKEQDYSSLSKIEENLSVLQSIESLEISIKLHPFSGTREKSFIDLEESLKKNPNIKIIPKTETITSYIESSNIFICDISAVISECLAAKSPIFLYIPQEKEIKISHSNIPYEEYCYIYSTSEELEEGIKNLLNGDDFLEANRLKSIDYIIGLKETESNLFIENLKNMEEIKC